jgi:DNA-directed RNA polymerase subunit RPC12/RpoP
MSMTFNDMGGGFSQAPRQIVDVSAMNIKCSECGAPILELPFNPDPARTSTLKCRDCMRKFKQAHGPRRF